MAGSITSQFKVVPYDGKGSFTLWQRRVKDILVQQGLARALKGEDGKPEKMTDDEWEDLGSRCVSTIRLCLADNIINNVIDEDSAPKLWEKLEKLHLGKGLTTKLNLKRDLYKLKMVEGGNLMEHLNVFKGLLDQLARVDVEIEEEDQALLLLTSLPDSYEHIITTILYGKDSLKIEDVQSTLLSNEKRKKAEDGPDSIFVAYDENRKGRSATKGFSGNSRSKSKGSGKGKQCYRCKEWGHLKRDCPRKNQDGQGSGGSTAVAEGYDSGDLLTVSHSDTFSPSDWIFDSGSSSHVCFMKEQFDSFQETKRGSFSLPDGSKVESMGTGCVKIKMFDGVERTLGGVAYVPKLKRNLISLSQLDSKGCRCSVAGGALKVTRGSMILAKGEECGGLYRLITETSRAVGKERAHDIKYLRRVSFAGIAGARGIYFPSLGGGEMENPTKEGVHSRSLFWDNR